MVNANSLEEIVELLITIGSCSVHTYIFINCKQAIPGSKKHCMVPWKCILSLFCICKGRAYGKIRCHGRFKFWHRTLINFTIIMLNKYCRNWQTMEALCGDSTHHCYETWLHKYYIHQDSTTIAMNGPLQASLYYMPRYEKYFSYIFWNIEYKSANIQ